MRRLANAHPDKQIMFLDRTVCYCSTMNRIDLPHLVWALEELVAGRVPNQITVDARDRRATPGSPSTGCSPCPDRQSYHRLTPAVPRRLSVPICMPGELADARCCRPPP